MYPVWLNVLAKAYLALCLVSALAVVIGIARGRRHKMAIMNWVWPITALYFGPVAWYWHRRKSSPKTADKQRLEPFWPKVFTAATHCGSGCTLGDFFGEWIVYLAGIVIAGSTLWADYVFDFVLAYLFGIIFQYFSIAPMRNISGLPGIWAAIKADSISLVAFEIGMFAFMALTHKILFPGTKPNNALYWFMMQIAMLVGFATTFPANWWLIKIGWKETM